VATIVQVFSAKALDHELFFEREFDPERCGAEENGDETSNKPSLQRRAQQSEKNSCVDGMAHETIGTAHNQCVPLLDRDGSAPVFAEYEPRPDAEGDSTNRERETKECGRSCHGEGWLIKPVRMGRRGKEKIESDEEDYSLLQPGCCRFALDSRFGERSGTKPDSGEQKPEYARGANDQVDGDSMIHIPSLVRQR